MNRADRQIHFLETSVLAIAALAAAVWFVASQDSPAQMGFAVAVAILAAIGFVRETGRTMRARR